MMMKSTLLSFLLSASLASAAVQELLPQLASGDLEVQTQAQRQLFQACAQASRPGAETERKAICQDICAALGSAPVPVARLLVQRLERIGAEESVEPLVSLLAHPDQHLRDDARRALSANPSPQAGQALVAQLKMRKARTPAETAGWVMALGERGEAGSSALIAAQLPAADPQLFAAVVVALGQLNEPEGIRVLAEQRQKETGLRKAMLDAALFATGRKAVFEKLYAASETEEVRAVALIGLSMDGGQGVAAEAMASGKPALQCAVIEAASQSQDAALLDLVARQLPSLASHLQVRALAVLEFSGKRNHAAVIEPLLASENTDVRDAAAQALGRIGTAQSVPALLACGTPAALAALGMLDADGVDKMLEAVAAKPGGGDSRAAAIEALALRGRTDLVPQLVSYAAENDAKAAKAAIAGIGSIGSLPDLDALCQLMLDQEASPLSRDILEAMVDIMRRSDQPGKVVGILVAKMGEASPRGQVSILQALVRTGSAEALPPVVAACRSADEALAKQAVKLLGGWGTENGLPAMLELAGDEALPVAGHVELMRGISRLLAGQDKLDEALAVQALGTARRPDEKKLLLDVLAKAKSPKARAAVEACLQDPALKEQAAEALEKMQKPDSGKGNGGNDKKKKSKA